VLTAGCFFFANGSKSPNLTSSESYPPRRATHLPVRKGFSLLELLAVLGLLGLLTALSFPAWRTFLDSGARRTGEALVMEALEHARGEAISSGREVWLVLRHDGEKTRDAFRIVARSGVETVSLGGWTPLPAGITFHTGSHAIPDARPPRGILETAGNPPGGNESFGAMMFLRSGSIGWPKPGECSLCIPLDSKNGTRVVSLSRGTGRASIPPAQKGNP